ncbi:hypothetical protein KKB40_01310, partial [Patescibacteria group bacterium]|nr:hypothetical protein [Patescibacteria group bacterium]
MKNQRDKLQRLLESKRKTLERLKKVEERMSEEKGNEEVWPGHESTRYFDDLNQYQVLVSHLEGIEKEIKEFKKE